MKERGLRTKINPIDDVCDLKAECNHKYEYIATEIITTDNWNYGEKECKEEIIVYCPLCHIHNRMSKEEWINYQAINRKEKDLKIPISSFSKNKFVTFEAENSFFNYELILETLLNNKEGRKND